MEKFAYYMNDDVSTTKVSIVTSTMVQKINGKSNSFKTSLVYLQKENI